MVKVDIKKLKDFLLKASPAIEKNKINPKAGWVEIEEFSDGDLSVKVASYDYYIEVVLPSECTAFDYDNHLHATVSADTFIPLISKMDDDMVYVSSGYNCVIFSTSSNEYTFPVITEFNKVKSVDEIKYNPMNGSNTLLISGKDIASIADRNSKGLVDAVISKEVQQYVYVDVKGAITFTENVYINSFDNASSKDDSLTPYTKFLLNCRQAKFLKVFDLLDEVTVDVELFSEESSKKVKFHSKQDGASIDIVFIVQSDNLTDKFPSIRLRELADRVRDVHVVLNRKLLCKALERLMVFDKRFDITVLDYSKLVFSENDIKLVSIKNKNYEKMDYIRSTNAEQYEAIVRFADLLQQLKATKENEVDISYGDSAIVINYGKFKQLIPENKVSRA